MFNRPTKLTNFYQAAYCRCVLEGYSIPSPFENWCRRGRRSEKERDYFFADCFRFFAQRAFILSAAAWRWAAVHGALFLGELGLRQRHGASPP